MVKERRAIPPDFDRHDSLAEELWRIAEIGRVISSTLNLAEVYPSFAEHARALIPFGRLVIATFSEDETELVDRYVGGIRIDGAAEGSRIRVPHDDQYRRVFVEKNHFLVSGSDMDEYQKRSQQEVVRLRAGLKSLLIVPLVWQSSVHGVLTFRAFDPAAFGEHEVELAWQVANQIAGAIAGANQFARLERESAERDRIAEIGRIVSSTLNLSGVYANFAEQARSLVPADRLVISVYTDDGSELVEQFVDGVEIEDSAVGRRLPVLRNDVYEHLVVRKLHLLSDGRKDSGGEASSREEEIRFSRGLKSRLIVPLIWQGTVVGLLTFRSFSPDAFDGRKVDLAWQIANQIAGAISAADQYSKLEVESRERERLADEQLRIAEIGRIVSSTLDLDDVFSAFVEQAAHLVPFDRVVVSLVNSDGETIKDAFISGQSIDDGNPEGIHPIENDVKKSVIEQNKVLVANVAQYEIIVKAHASEMVRFDSGLKSLLVVPLAWKGAVVGTLSFRSLMPSPYGDHEVDLASQIGAQIAGAVAASNQYSLLESESRERARLADEQLRIAEIGRIVSSTLDLDEVFSAFAEHAKVLVPFDRLVISLNEADGKTTVDAFVSGKRFEDEVSRGATVISGGAKESVIRDNEVLVANEDAFVELAKRLDFESARLKAGLKSLLVVPLSWQGSVVGTLIFRSHQPNPYGEHEVDLARQVGAQIAGAVATADQYWQLREAVSDIRTQAAALNASADAVVILKPDNSIEYVNDAFVRDTGYSRDEAIDRKSPLLRSDKDPPAVYDEMWETVRSGNPWSGTLTAQRKDGSEYLIEISMTPVFDNGGEIARYISVWRDITERVEAEKERAAAADKSRT